MGEAIMNTKMITSMALALAGVLASTSAVHAQATAAVPSVDTISQVQGPQEGTGPWTSLGGGTVGIAGQPTIGGSGSLVGGTQATIRLKDAPPSAPMLAWVSFSSMPLSAVGGTVYAFPFTIQLLFSADSNGYFVGTTTWPAAAPPSTYVQFIIQDLSVPSGLTLSNALLASSPG
jgi:hypothetical protein